MAIETFRFKEIIDKYDCVILDSSTFGSSSELPEKIYEAKIPSRLRPLEPCIDTLLETFIKSKNLLAGKPNIYLVSGVKEEISLLRNHFLNSYNFLSSQMNIEKKIYEGYKKYKSVNGKRHPHSNRYINKIVEKKRSTALYEGDSSEVIYNLENLVLKLKDISNCLDSIINGIPLLPANQKIPRIPETDISETDIELVNALVTYTFANPNKKGIIITSDRHIFRTLVYFLRPLMPRIREDMRNRSLIGFYRRDTENMVIVEAYDPYHYKRKSA